MQRLKSDLGVQLYVNIAAPLPELLQPIENDLEAYYRQKPTGGFWTSTWREETEDSAWVEWCGDENYGNVEECYWYLLTPKQGCKLYTIDSQKDFHRCLSEYGFPPSIASAHSLFAEKRVIDFEKLAQEFDGVHLTERGNAQTHLSYPNDLNAWDCESTLWFRWCFTKVRQFSVPKSLHV